MQGYPDGEVLHAPFLFLPLGALFAGIFGGHAESGALCSRYDLLTDHLTLRYNEHAVASGLPDNGKSYLEIWASEAGTWSVLVVVPNGPTCLIHSGQDFELIKYEPKRQHTS